jgi:hypothetical protein
MKRQIGSVRCVEPNETTVGSWVQTEHATCEESGLNAVGEEDPGAGVHDYCRALAVAMVQERRSNVPRFCTINFYSYSNCEVRIPSGSGRVVLLEPSEQEKKKREIAMCRQKVHEHSQRS